MIKSNFSKKRIIHIAVILFVLIMMALITGVIIFKYNVEGEKNLPFKINKMNIISTAESILNTDEQSEWKANITQKNNIFFTIAKNDNYKKEDSIKKISFMNFKSEVPDANINVNIYRPTSSVNDYNYTEEYKIEDSLEFVGGLESNTEVLQINNQGGRIGFSVLLENLGECNFVENEKIPSDGRLLEKIGKNTEDIKFKLYFDIIIETNSGNSFKSNVVLDLPTGDIVQDGVGILEDTELKSIVFKRM